MGGCVGGDREQAEVRDPFSNQPFKKSLLLLMGMPGNSVRYLKLKNTSCSKCLDSKREVSTQTKMGWQTVFLQSSGTVQCCCHKPQI